MEVKEIGMHFTQDSNNLNQELVELETASGHVFSVLLSFLDQQADPLMCPYDVGVELVFKLDDGDVIDDLTYETNRGNYISASEVDFKFD